jgi:hypothetical protein
MRAVHRWSRALQIAPIVSLRVLTFTPKRTWISRLLHAGGKGPGMADCVMILPFSEAAWSPSRAESAAEFSGWRRVIRSKREVKLVITICIVHVLGGLRAL